MKPVISVILFSMLVGTSFSQPAILDVFCLKALKEPLVKYFTDFMTEEELRLDADAQLDLILENATMRSLQIDSDKEKELLISMPFRADRAGGYVVVMDHDRKGGWKCLGILFGGDAAVEREMHNGCFDLTTIHHLGGDHLVKYTHRFEKGSYERIRSKNLKLEGH